MDSIPTAQAERSTRAVPVLAIHGGAGTLLRSGMSQAKAAAYEAALKRVLQAGQQQLAAGASALDVVVEAVRELEECELFNAGRGAVYTAVGTHELDACVMDGAGLRAGAVAGMAFTRNPVLAARAVLEHSEHVLLMGEAADVFAAGQGLEQVAPDWFGTPQRLEQLRRAQAGARGQLLDHDGQHAVTACGTDSGAAPLDETTKFGTVGAVALDAQAHLAAATSTGGMTNKQPGRIGDSPLIGAGCYANDATVAVSCTGTGEAFMRGVAAYDLAALMDYAGLSLKEAAERVVMDKLPRLGGRGGLIAVAANGEVCLPFNTEGMYRGVARVGEPVTVAIYGESA
ncbi:isoaspartyl peptidase/L-asparaginase family protein [Roseateles toxinivorans]|uniref:Isoaspartyl peptidase n=1 Tax=Roseateles toxinivorans TaxID=270368 RepID=A0A4R6QH13_9BURK|nr:isoaspartyl peptidase/L-asparaginase [Roseateles toxinivorans]TDP61273.1 beta-aspartyl-peptidase (threonine type) [Roseateles toxinivorans]